jgi:type II pantothenate kinase
VILAANTSPSLNDITAEELNVMVEGIAEWDAVIGGALARGEIEVIASGCGTPLIDLSRVSVELAEAVVRRGVDLVVLEGMGRAVESNLHAKFTCDVMNLALVKDPDVARHIGGEMYDQVMRFEAGRGA